MLNGWKLYEVLIDGSRFSYNSYSIQHACKESVPRRAVCMRRRWQLKAVLLHVQLLLLLLLHWAVWQETLSLSQ